MFTSFLIALANTPAERINKYGDRGQPCLIPLLVKKKLFDQLLFRTQLSVHYKELSAS